ncbi:MAG: TonB-dependent receptor [Reichenbachiella sp.]
MTIKLTTYALFAQLMFVGSLSASAEDEELKAKSELADITISGRILDEAGEALPGTSVLVEGTTIGTVTDIDGNFKLTVADDAILIVSFIGYNTQKIPVGGQSTFNISMEVDAEQLEEVVVVGYGTQKKESLTAAVAVIGNDAIQTTTHSSLAQKLQGKVAGLQIRQEGGQPGTFDNSINIRGFGNPLYVIDGIRREGSGEFQRLNAEDIESISVLKDASAAIYGLGAANGVILVTTKKGGKGKPKFNYNVVLGQIRPTNMPDMANAAQYTQMWNDSQIMSNGGGNEPFYEEETIQNWIDGGPGYESTDWYDETMKDYASYQQHNLSMSGGSEKTSYYVGFGFVDEEGLLKSDDMGYKRYNLRSNLTSEIANNLEAQLLVAGRWDKKEQPGENFFNIFKGTRKSLPTESPFIPGTDLPQTIFGDQNPVALAERDLTGYNEEITQSFQSSFSLNYKIPWVDGLSVKGVVSYDVNNYMQKGLAKPYSLHELDMSDSSVSEVKYRNGTGSLSQRSIINNYLTFQGYLTYNKTIASKHDIGAVFVVEQNERFRRDFQVRRYYGPFYTKDQLRFTEVDRMESDGIELREADVSYIGRFNYAYDNKYLVEFAARYMGSYRYGPENRWGLFPMGSIGWKVSEESFLKNNVSQISLLKLRASYGITGAPEGSAFQYVPGFQVNSGGVYQFEQDVETVGISAPIPANQNLTWQTAKTLDIGFDLGLWTNKLTVSGDYYERLLEGIPARPDVAFTDTFGGEVPQENLNSKLTKGYELTIGYTDDLGELSYNISGNVSVSRTKKLHVEGENYTNSYDRWRNQSGDRWEGIRWGYTYVGQFQNEDELRDSPMQNGDTGNIMKELPGDFIYQDMNGDGVINGNDQSPIFPDENPRINFGLSIDLAWKGFDFNMLWQGAAGNTLRMREIYATNFAFRGNSPAYLYDRWTKDPYDDDAEWEPGEWPASRTNGDVGAMYWESNRWRRDASYVRLKSMEIGYTMNYAALKKVGIQNLRIYAAGFNLLTFADDWVKPFDPEKIADNYSAGFNYPLAKTFNLGLSVNF